MKYNDAYAWEQREPATNWDYNTNLGGRAHGRMIKREKQKALNNFRLKISRYSNNNERSFVWWKSISDENKHLVIRKWSNENIYVSTHNLEAYDKIVIPKFRSFIEKMISECDNKKSSRALALYDIIN